MLLLWLCLGGWGLIAWFGMLCVFVACISVLYCYYFSFAVWFELVVGALWLVSCGAGLGLLMWDWYGADLGISSNV